MNLWTISLYLPHAWSLLERQLSMFNFLWWVLLSLTELFTWIKFFMCISFCRSKILLSTFSLEKGRNCSKLSLQWKGNPYVWTCNKTLFLRAYVANWWQHGSACPGVLGFAFDSLHILQWIYIWNPFLVGKMRFIQNI